MFETPAIPSKNAWWVIDAVDYYLLYDKGSSDEAPLQAKVALAHEDNPVPVKVPLPGWRRS